MRGIFYSLMQRLRHFWNLSALTSNHLTNIREENPVLWSRVGESVAVSRHGRRDRTIVYGALAEDGTRLITSEHYETLEDLTYAVSEYFRTYSIKLGIYRFLYRYT